jgi:Tfp pilus assembly protein PilO
MKRFIIPVTLILLSSAIYVIYIDRFWNDISTALAKRTELEATIEKAKEANEKIDSLSKKYAAVPAETLRRLDVMLPEQVDPTRLVVDVNTIAARSGLILKGTTVMKGKKEGKQGVTHSLRFSVSAPYVVFNAFMLDLERSLALRDSSSISFNSTTDENGNGGVRSSISEYSVVIDTYSLN